MRHWWVNHKQTRKEEVEGGYLWSPTHKKNGSRNHFYDNMRLARPGDSVLSYGNSIIEWLGTVTQSAFPSPRPSEFGALGEQWGYHGWLLPVEWRALPAGVRPKAHEQIIRPLLPAKYSPLSVKDLGGNQGCYLAEISPALFQSIMAVSEADPAILMAEEPQFLSESKSHLDATATVLPDEFQQYGSDVIRQTSVRRGHEIFRRKVLSAFNYRCVVTGAQMLLKASHIKPWRVSDSREKVDAKNGLLLTAGLDALFDDGAISFDAQGHMIASSEISSFELDAHGARKFIGKKILTPDAERLVYLSYHRANVFKT